MPSVDPSDKLAATAMKKVCDTGRTNRKKSQVQPQDSQRHLYKWVTKANHTSKNVQLTLLKRNMMRPAAARPGKGPAEVRDPWSAGCIGPESLGYRRGLA